MEMQMEIKHSVNGLLDGMTVTREFTHGGRNYWMVNVAGHEFIGRLDAAWNLCERCGGCGSFSYNPRHGTVCYGCDGAGIGKRLDGWAHALRLAKARNAKEARRVQAAAEAARRQAAEWIVWLEAVGSRTEMVEWLTQFEDDKAGFLRDMAERAAAMRPFSERQEAAVLKVKHERETAKDEAVESRWWGEVKKRASVEVTITRVKPIESFYGLSWLVVMTTADGAILKTFASGQFGEDAKDRVGEVHTIKATVKERGTWKEVKETTVTRCARA